MSGTSEAAGAGAPLALADGTRLAWDRTGDGPVVLLVHGIGSSRKTWDGIVPQLVAAGYGALRLDLRLAAGSPSSPGGAFGMDDYLRDLVSFVDAVGLQTFHLVGHSLGGMIAQRYALDHPARVRSLALASTTSHNGRRANAFAQLMVTLAEHGYDALEERPALREAAEATLREAFPAGVPPLSMLERGMERPNPSRANAWRACIEFSTKDRLSEVRVSVSGHPRDGRHAHPLSAPVRLVRPGRSRGPRGWSKKGAGHSLPKRRPSSFGHALTTHLAALLAS